MPCQPELCLTHYHLTPSSHLYLPAGHILLPLAVWQAFLPPTSFMPTFSGKACSQDSLGQYGMWAGMDHGEKTTFSTETRCPGLDRTGMGSGGRLLIHRHSTLRMTLPCRRTSVHGGTNILASAAELTWRFETATATTTPHC